MAVPGLRYEELRLQVKKGDIVQYINPDAGDTSQFVIISKHEVAECIHLPVTDLQGRPVVMEDPSGRWTQIITDNRANGPTMKAVYTKSPLSQVMGKLGRAVVDNQGDKARAHGLDFPDKEGVDIMREDLDDKVVPFDELLPNSEHWATHAKYGWGWSVGMDES